jgi:hypothetical protein
MECMRINPIGSRAMASNILADSGRIKEIVVNTQGTPTQKLLAILIAAGVQSTAEMAELIGVQPRAIQKAKRPTGRVLQDASELQDASHSSQTNHRTPKANSGTVARVEDNNITNYPEPTVVEVKCSEVLLRATAPKPKREAQGTRLDREWSLPESWRQWARTTFPSTTADSIASEAETFRDYWISTAGAKGRKADWEATWRNWCRRNLATAPIRPRSQPPPSASASRTAEIRALLNVGGSA